VDKRRAPVETGALLGFWVLGVEKADPAMGMRQPPVMNPDIFCFT
jgi:hypothetical protein